MATSVKITSADFNGSSWDGSPFEPAPWPEWLISALKAGRIEVQPGSEDYAWWRIKTRAGLKVAGPGDFINFDPSDDQLWVRYTSDDAWRRFKHLSQFASSRPLSPMSGEN